MSYEVKSQETKANFKRIIADCKNIFINKTRDYGTSWRVFRPSSLTDQIYIKAARIRRLQEKQAKINESIEDCFKAIINYSVITLIQLELNNFEYSEFNINEASDLYDKHINAATDLMMNKTHDYDEAWRVMRVSSMTDIILTKLLRIKQIENNNGITNVSEGVEGNYHDIINYSLFCLILLENE